MLEPKKEHNAKNEMDQEFKRKLSVGISRMSRRLELINALVNSQFQPLIFSIESNPLLSATMRPYIEALHEQTRITAFFFSEIAGHQEGMADSYWLAAEKYVDSLGVWAEALSSSTQMSFDECSRILQEAFPLQKYFQLVWELAHEMWISAGRPYFRALDFWVLAERHILTIVGKSIANYNTLFEAIGSLGRAFSDFAPDAYLSDIRERAYYIWKALGEPHSHALDDWLQAEEMVLSGSPEEMVLSESLPERFTATMYIEGGTKQDATELAKLIERFMEELGYSIEEEEDLIQGSFIKRWVFCIKTFIYKGEVQDRAKIVEDTLFGHAAVDVDEKIVTMIAKLIESLDKKGSSAAFDTGLFIFLKISDGKGSFQFLAKRLNIRDRALLNDNPSILGHPDQVLKYLSLKTIDNDRLKELRKIAFRAEEDKVRGHRVLPPAFG